MRPSRSILVSGCVMIQALEGKEIVFLQWDEEFAGRALELTGAFVGIEVVATAKVRTNAVLDLDMRAIGILGRAGQLQVINRPRTNFPHA